MKAHKSFDLKISLTRAKTLCYNTFLKKKRIEGIDGILSKTENSLIYWCSEVLVLYDSKF